MAIIDAIKGTKITVKGTNGKSVEIDIADILSINDADISKEFVQQPALYGFFSVLLARAERDAALADLQKDQEYAMADASVREELEMSGIKSTEAMVKNMVMTDAEYAAAVAKKVEADYEQKVLKALSSALQQRAEMLISLGAHLRHEIDQTGMNIRERQFSKSVEEMKENLRSARSTKARRQV